MSKLAKILLLFSGLSLVSFVIVRFLVGFWIPFLWIPLALFGGLAGAAIYQDRSLYKDFFTMKTTKQGMSMGALIGLVIFFLVVVNFIAVRKYATFDFSLAQVNSLSAQSVQLVRGLKQELRVLYFYQKGTEGVEENRRAFIELMKKYQDQSPQVKLEFIDVNERPDLTEQYAVNKGNGVVFLDYMGRKSQIQKIDEQEITSALVKVTREKDKVIYFTTGHAEKNLEDSKDPGGLNALKSMLEGNRYTVKTLSLVSQNGSVPEDADLVMAVGPQQTFLDSEILALQKYLDRGGSAIFALEPKALDHLQKFLQANGVEIGNNYLVNFVDTQIGRAVNPQVTTGLQFSNESPITKPFEKGLFSVFRLPMEVKLADKLPAGYQGEVLVKTSDKTMAYADTNFKVGGKIGTYDLAVIVQAKKAEKSFSLVVFGDADFMTNQMLYQNLNRDLILNSVAFLAKEENLISIAPREVGVTQMQLSETAFYAFIFCFILVVPAALLIAGGVIGFKRRYA